MIFVILRLNASHLSVSFLVITLSGIVISFARFHGVCWAGCENFPPDNFIASHT